MSTNVISKNVVVGSIVSSLILASFAFMPLAADAAGTEANTTTGLACMKTAVETRENALASAFDAYTDDITQGLSERKADLLKMWALTDKAGRATELKQVWTNWKKVRKDAHTELKTKKKAAWTTFKTTAKTTCKEVVPRDEALGSEAAGSISL